MDDDGHLLYFVFRKDYASHKENPLELLDDQKRYRRRRGRQHARLSAERVPALLAAGADVLCIDSSEGYSELAGEARIAWVREQYGDSVKIGAGNVVDRDGFLFLAKAGADFRQGRYRRRLHLHYPRDKGNRPRSGHGAHRGLPPPATNTTTHTGIYVPICSDGGIVYDYHMTLALAMGADFLMLGRYFARFDESPTAKVMRQRRLYEGILGRGLQPRTQLAALRPGRRRPSCPSRKAWTRYVPYAGSLHGQCRYHVSDKVQLHHVQLRRAQDHR